MSKSIIPMSIEMANVQTSTSVIPTIEEYKQVNEENIESKVKSSYVRFIGKHPRKICLLYVVLTALVAIYGVGVFNYLNVGGFQAPNSESTKTNRYYTEEFVQPSPDIVVLMEHPTWTVDNDNYKESFYQFKEKLLDDIPEAFGFISYFDYNFITGFVSSDQKKSLATFRLPQEIVNNNKLQYSDFQKTADGNALSIYFTGSLLSGETLTNQLSTDLMNIEFGSVPVLLVLLVFAFGGLISFIVPISLMIFTLIFTFAALRLLTLGFEVTTYVTDVTLIFGIGLAIDFSIFISLRYKEEITKKLIERGITDQTARWDEEMVLEAIENSLFTSGRTVLFSCILLVTTLSGALQFHEYFVTTMALAVIFPAVFAAFGALTYVLAFFILLNSNIKRLSTDRLVNYLFNYFQLNYSKVDNNSNKDTKIENNIDNQIDTSKDIETDNQIDIKENKSKDNKISFQLEKVTSYQSIRNAMKSYIPFPSTRYTALPEYYYIKDEEDPMFMFIYTVMTYPYFFAAIILACLIALFTIFCVEVKFANGSWGNLPIHSKTRYVAEVDSKDFPSYGKTALNVFLKTKDSLGVRDEQFLGLLNSYTYLLGNHSYVVDVGSMMNYDKTKNYTTLIQYYGDPYNPDWYNFTKNLVDPFYLTNFEDITQVTVSLSIVESDSHVPEVVRFVRKLTSDHFKVSNEQSNVLVDSWIVSELDHKIIDKEKDNMRSNKINRHLRSLSSTSSTSLLAQHGVTGSPAIQYDVNTDILDVLPDFITVVILAMFFFVLILTNSIVLPFKAIFLSIVSIGGSFGFLLLVFQNNTGTSTLQFYNPENALDPLQLLFIFVVSFGLSLDYEVFMMGRIQEIYQRTKDNKYAVSKGISSSATSVTLAALLLCIALGGFLASKIMLLQMIGMGIGLTIMLDATVIRTILLPAIMSILGDFAWYCPKPLSEIIQYVGIKE